MCGFRDILSDRTTCSAAESEIFTSLVPPAAPSLTRTIKSEPTVSVTVHLFRRPGIDQVSLVVPSVECREAQSYSSHLFVPQSGVIRPKVTDIEAFVHKASCLMDHDDLAELLDHLKVLRLEWLQPDGKWVSKLGIWASEDCAYGSED